MLRRFSPSQASCGLKVSMAVVAALLVANCSATRNETEAAATFSKSAAALADAVKTAYAQAPQDEADLRAGRYVTSDHSYERAQSLGITTLKGRMAAATVLSAYGQSLATLLDVKTQETNISTATGQLSAAVKGLPKSVLTQTSITASEIDTAGKVLTIAIEAYLDYRRREVLQQIVPVMEPIVTKLCAKFGNDFDVNQPGFAQVYYNAADRILDHAASVTSGGDLAARSTVLPVFQRVDAIRTKTEVTFATVKEAANSCVKSSLALRDAVQNPDASFDDILDFANKAEAAYSAVLAAISSKRG
jgi:hypothetical protein